jgi:Ni,Fe-hydrogenase maturation factor
MRALVVTLGNPLRRDDGVAHAVPKYLNCESRSLLHLTPEVAEDIARFDTVIFIDADVRATDVSIERVAESPSSPALTHVSTAAQVVALSKALFGFSGRAFQCRIPAGDLSYQQEPSGRAKVFVEHVVEQLRRQYRIPIYPE